jgi:hypothetical protein
MVVMARALLFYMGARSGGLRARPEIVLNRRRTLGSSAEKRGNL